jgi:hypothetical protein
VVAVQCSARAHSSIIKKLAPPGWSRRFSRPRPQGHPSHRISQLPQEVGVLRSGFRGKGYIINLRLSAAASPRTPDPNSRMLPGSGAGANSPDKIGPLVEGAFPAYTLSIPGLLPR